MRGPGKISATRKIGHPVVYDEAGKGPRLEGEKKDIRLKYAKTQKRTKNQTIGPSMVNVALSTEGYGRGLGGGIISRGTRDREVG